MARPDSTTTLGGGQQLPLHQDDVDKTLRHPIESEPSVGDWLRNLIPTRNGMSRYVRDIFVFTHWLPRYNWSWLVGDGIAGLTVGFVVIPQAMAYALLANLSPEYGLYTSFVGAALYWVFGTSKDIVIGVCSLSDPY
jgi:solute carrier family 26 (sodium-independent sulfate anion transporter), member 11